jgi:glycosyltransferase involved in cell wall biosynthesis
MRAGPNVGGVRKILAWARGLGIDLLHSHGYKGNILFGSMPAGVRRLPMLTTLHGWTATRRLSRLRLYEWLDSRLLRFMDAVVLVCGGMRAHPWLAGRNLPLRVVCNGIPAFGREQDSPRLDAEIVEFCRSGFTIGAIGRLSPEKGFDRLLAGFAEIAGNDLESRLLILGEGEERAALASQISRLGLARRVLLPGYREGAGRYLRHFGLFVLSSSTEGLPLTVLEAMRAGTPVLATRVGALPELLEEGRAGFLLDAADAADAAGIAAGIRMVRRQPHHARQRADRARSRVLSRYSSARMAAGYAAIYEQILEKTGKPMRIKAKSFTAKAPRAQQNANRYPGQT